MRHICWSGSICRGGFYLTDIDSSKHIAGSYFTCAPDKLAPFSYMGVDYHVRPLLFPKKLQTKQQGSC